MEQAGPSREWLPKTDTLTLIGVTATSEQVVVEADGPSPVCLGFVVRPPLSHYSTMKTVVARATT